MSATVPLSASPRELERRRAEGVPVAERIAALRAALDDLEYELMHAERPADVRNDIVRG